ncbi:MAG: Antitoxin HicB [Pseudorhodoplanes sp.]|nr:Antitoxin HicB [Pseudorhodoplanes sp.]
MIYRLHTEQDDNGTLLVTCPAFPEVTTFADGPEDAVARGTAAIEEAIAARFADGQDIPAPDDAGSRRGKLFARLPIMTAMKVQLYNELRRSEVKTRAELARRMGKPRETVDRLFRLDHASKTDQIENAFRALGKEVEFRIT